MVMIMKAQHQAEYLGYAQSLFEYAIALEEEDEDDNILVDDEDFEADDLSEIIELSALQWTELALSMSGNGSHGPYNQFPKSTNFFFYISSSTRPIFLLDVSVSSNLSGSLISQCCL